MHYPLIITLFLYSGEAFAYLDGGLSAMLIQLIVGGAVGALVTIKLYWEKLVGVFQRLRYRSKDVDSEDCGESRSNIDDTR